MNINNKFYNMNRSYQSYKNYKVQKVKNIQFQKKKQLNKKIKIMI